MCKWKIRHNTLSVFLLLGSIFFCGCPDAKDRFVPTLPPQPPAADSWTYRIGGDSYDYGIAACMDENGNVYIAGDFSSESVNFAEDWGGTDVRVCAGPSYDVFITKLNTSGDYVWTHTIGGPEPDAVHAICADRNGNIYVVGQFDGTVNFAEDWGGTDEKICIGGYDVFITKINANGDYGWTRKIGGTQYDTAMAICTDASGNVYVAGYFWTPTVNFAQDWGLDDTKDCAGDCDVFIMRIDADGEYGWTYRIGGADFDYPKAVCVDESGNIYLTGIFQGTVNFAQDWGGNDEKVGGSTVYSHAFITKIGPTGGYIWTRDVAAGIMNQVIANGICTDSKGNVYVVGEFYGFVNFGDDWGAIDTKTSATTDYPRPPMPSPEPGLTYTDIFVMKINAGGGYCWTYRMGAPYGDRANAVCTDANGNVYMTGDFQTTVNFGEDWGGNDEKTGPDSPYCDTFITKIDAAGDYCWTHRIGGQKSDYAFAICADPGGNIYLTGHFGETVNFTQDWGGTEIKTSAGECDVFITKIVQP